MKASTRFILSKALSAGLKAQLYGRPEACHYNKVSPRTSVSPCLRG